MPTREDFKTELIEQINRAQKQGRTHVEINAGEMHRAIGGYPSSTTHRMPLCCEAMRAEMVHGDEIVFEPNRGDGASLTIRYCLPH